MLIAKIENNQVKEIADYREIFPGTSFSTNGPTKEFLSENNCKIVTVYKQHDRQLEKMIPCEPYIEGDEVFTVEVVNKTQEELQQDQLVAAQRLQKEIVDKVQQRLDAFARTRNYDGILSACTYATSTIPKFQAEGQYAVNARDLTWATLYQILDEVQSGTRPVPNSFADIEPDLPALNWPTQGN